ncbi:MAG: hypothetical protein K2R98_08425 [Gemmataceae bacterium]|nr:hypothetical protein [Gemmataceae bacterium]
MHVACLMLSLSLCDPPDDGPDMGRWPSLAYVEAQLELNDGWTRQAKSAQAQFPNREELQLGRLIGILEDRRWYWAQLRQAHRARCAESRQAALEYLRQWLGDEAFWAGRLPDVVPLRLPP